MGIGIGFVPWPVPSGFSIGGFAGSGLPPVAPLPCCVADDFMPSILIPDSAA
jgi:hypothetical protein